MNTTDPICNCCLAPVAEGVEYCDECSKPQEPNIHPPGECSACERPYPEWYECDRCESPVDLHTKTCYGCSLEFVWPEREYADPSGPEWKRLRSENDALRRKLDAVAKVTEECDAIGCRWMEYGAAGEIEEKLRAAVGD